MYLNVDALDHVCTYEQAERLMHLGVIQESLFYFPKFPPDERGLRLIYRSEFDNPRSTYKKEDCYSAFTSTEVGKALNWDIVSIAAPYKKDHEWRFSLMGSEKNPHDENEVSARTEILIDGIEKNIIPVAQVNNKLRPFTIRKAV